MNRPLFDPALFRIFNASIPVESGARQATIYIHVLFACEANRDGVLLTDRSTRSNEAPAFVHSRATAH